MTDVEQTPAGHLEERPDLDDKGSSEAVIQTDKHGLPLVPQPSVWKDDPLVYFL